MRYYPPAPPLLGASTVCRSTRNSGSSATGPHVDQTLLSGGAGGHVPGAPGSMLNNPEGSVVDISSGKPGQRGCIPPAGSALGGYYQQLTSVYRTSFRCWTSSPYVNYCVAVLRDGVKSAGGVGRSRKAARRILQDIGLP